VFARDQAGLGEPAERLLDRADADAEVLGQLFLGGQPVAFLEQAGFHLLYQRLADPGELGGHCANGVRGSARNG
jgi:hypothetical protein